MKIVEFSPAARAELDAAAQRYDQERPGRGARFYAAVERAVELVCEFPTAGPAYQSVRTEHGVRRRVVRGFPFVLAYRVRGERIRIDAVTHMRRRPGYGTAEFDDAIRRRRRILQRTHGEHGARGTSTDGTARPDSGAETASYVDEVVRAEGLEP